MQKCFAEICVFTLEIVGVVKALKIVFSLDGNSETNE